MTALQPRAKMLRERRERLNNLARVDLSVL
jgi:hypothetical protein